VLFCYVFFLSVYGDWEEWSDCSHSCGPDGTAFRSKSCLLGNHAQCAVAAPMETYAEDKECNTDIVCNCNNHLVSFNHVLLFFFGMSSEIISSCIP
jgi:hypothetical protein